MIKKEFRLKTWDIKKVLKNKKKPFFSYGIILYKNNNYLKKNRFRIIIWQKNVRTSVERVFFRRFFYNIISKYSKLELSENNWIDYLFVLKKQTKLDKKNIQSINDFERDIKFLLKK